MKSRGSSEAAINSRLRELAEETRRLREELRDMLRPPPPPPPRAVVHQQTWPKESPSIAADRRRRRPRAPKKRGK